MKSKYVFLFILVSCFDLFSAQFVWDNSSGDKLWSTATNWDVDSVPNETTDTVTINSGSDTVKFDANVSVALVSVSNGYSGVLYSTATDRTISTQYGFTDNGSATRSYPSFTILGNNATVRFYSSIGTYSAANCNIVWYGTGGIFKDDKGLQFKTFTGKANSSGTSSGAQASIFQNSTTPVTFENNSSWTWNTQFSSRVAANGIYALSYGTGVTFNGSANWQVYPTSSYNILLPALTYTGTGAMNLLDGGAPSPSINSMGIITAGPISVIAQSAGSTLKFYLDGYNLKSTNFTITSSNATSKCIMSWGSAIDTIGSHLIGSHTGAIAETLSTASIYCTGSTWTFSSNAGSTVEPGTSLVTFTGAPTITSNGKRFYDVTFNNSSTGTAKTADSMTLLGDLILTDGRDSLAGISCVDYTNNNQDSVFQTSNLRIAGNFSRAANTIVKRTGGSMIFTTDANHTFTGNANQFGPVTCKNLQFLDSSRIQKLTIADSGLITLKESAGLKLDTVGDYEGSAGKLVYFESGSAGTRARLWLPAADTVGYVSFKDCSTSTTIKLDATCLTLGNNRNIKSLSYNGVSKDKTSGSAGTTITFTGSGFIGGGAKIGGTVVTLIVDSYTSAHISSPATYGDVIVWNSDLDTATVGTWACPPVISYAASPLTLTAGTAMTPAAVTNSGCTADSFTVAPALPTGLSLNKTTGAISGTPSAAQGATSYTVTAYNNAETSTATASVSITINSGKDYQDTLQMMIDSAKDGDVITIRAGTHIMRTKTAHTPALYVNNKSLWIRGVGGATKLYDSCGSDTYGNELLKVENTAGKTFRLSNMEIYSNGTDITSTEGKINIRGINFTGWRVDHIKFTDMRVPLQLGYYTKGCYGLVDHCRFNGRGHITVWGDSSSWGDSLKLGTDKAVYFENDTFAMTTNDNAIDCYVGGKFVLRNSSLTNCWVEAHGYSFGPRGSRGFEIYNNTITAGDDAHFVPISIRGGTGVIYNNTITGYDNNVIYLYNDRSCEETAYQGQCGGDTTGWTASWMRDGWADSTGWPCRDQIGRGVDSLGKQSTQPLYQWSNTTGAATDTVFVAATCASNLLHIKKNRDYYNGVEAPGYTAYVYPHPLDVISSVSNKKRSFWSGFAFGWR